MTHRRRRFSLQLYHREDARSNSLPPEVLHSSVYQPPLRERFNSLDSNYCSGAEHRAGLHRVGETSIRRRSAVRVCEERHTTWGSVVTCGFSPSCIFFLSAHHFFEAPSGIMKTLLLIMCFGGIHRLYSTKDKTVPSFSTLYLPAYHVNTLSAHIRSHITLNSLYQCFPTITCLHPVSELLKNEVKETRKSIR